jgi:hypothetical protein
MRYYEIWTPELTKQREAGEDVIPGMVTNVRSLRNLPEGTTIRRVITDRDGTAVDIEYIDVENGKAKIAKRGVRSVRMSSHL